MAEVALASTSWGAVVVAEAKHRSRMNNGWLEVPARTRSPGAPGVSHEGPLILYRMGHFLHFRPDVAAPPPKRGACLKLVRADGPLPASACTQRTARL